MTFPSGWQLVLLLAVLVILFGSTKLPAAARSIGQSLRIFKAETKGLRGEDSETAPDSQDEASPTAKQQTQELPPPSGQSAAPTEQTRNKQPQNNRDTSR